MTYQETCEYLYNVMPMFERQGASGYKEGLDNSLALDKHFGYRHTAGHWFRKDNNSGTIPSPEDWWELKKLLDFSQKFWIKTQSPQNFKDICKKFYYDKTIEDAINEATLNMRKDKEDYN